MELVSWGCAPTHELDKAQYDLLLVFRKRSYVRVGRSDLRFPQTVREPSSRSLFSSEDSKLQIEFVFRKRKIARTGTTDRFAPQRLSASYLSARERASRSEDP